jgi:hydroxymethylbilane synthase
MPPAPTRLEIGLRKSALSLCHGDYLRDRLQALYPRCEVTLRGITTQGDRILEKPLADIGGKGLFIEEIEVAMREGRADLAVHSLKDMPMDMAPGFELACVPVREDARDAFVSNSYASIEALPDGAVVGTSSLRREAQLREKNPRLAIRMLRGNVDTRLRKLDEGQYDAMILAAAGLIRLGRRDRITSLLDPAAFLPAVGQGALAIECASDRADVIEAVAPLTHRPTWLAVLAERAFSRALSGSCHTPIAGYATFRDGELWLRGLLATREGTEVLRGERSVALDAESGDIEVADALGRALAQEFSERGAARLIG